MGQSMDEFKEFVRMYPKLKFEVRDGKRTWQNIYEEWNLLGDDDESWNQYKDNKKDILDSVENQEVLRSVIGYVQKINPDNINKTLTTVQKLVQIFQGLSSSKDNRINYSPRNQPDNLFKSFRRYED